jgi:hypothetical protein
MPLYSCIVECDARPLNVVTFEADDEVIAQDHSLGLAIKSSTTAGYELWYENRLVAGYWPKLGTEEPQRLLLEEQERAAG